MIQFKTLKYKHKRQAEELSRLSEAGQAGDDQVMTFVLSLVESWDFADAETGQPLQLTTVADDEGNEYYPCLEELTLEQYRELLTAFNRRMGAGGSEVKKTSDSSASSGPTRSKKSGKGYQSRPNGLT